EKPSIRNKDLNGSSKSTILEESIPKTSTRGGRKSNTRTRTTKTRRKSVKWICKECGTRNHKKDNICRSCGGILPTITLFKASRRAIQFGNPIRLSWEVENADKVIINPGKELVENKGVLDVEPMETTEYVLTAYNEIGTKQLSTKVTLAPPKISQFKAAEKNITIGFPSIFHWKAKNAESLEIDMGVGDVSGKEFTEAYLKKPGKFTLIARNRSGVVRRSIEVGLNKPEISSFSVDTRIIKVGRPNLLMWEVHNTELVEVYPDHGRVEGNKVEVSPDRTTTYTLRASNDAGIIEKKIELILPPPKILHFAGDSELSIEGAAVNLSWEVENAYEIHIDQGIGEVEALGLHKVKPEAAFTTYTIFARGHSGESEQTFQITRFPIPIHEKVEKDGEPISESPDLRHNDLAMHLNEFEEMERQLRKDLKERKRDVHIQRAQKIDLTEDLLSLEKATLREEFSGLFKKLRGLFNKKPNT
ncbi:MAG: zinc finger Ran-binding domain-containing protein, partial [Bacteroidota bacterium]